MNNQPNLDDRLKEPDTVKQCWETGLQYFQNVCLVSKLYKCRYQGSVVDVQGRQYYQCKKFMQEKQHGS